MRFLFVFFLTFNSLFANDYKILSFDNHPIHGTLVNSNELSPFLAIIIAGSGPTDRDGNNSSMKSNYLKMLAEELNKKGISSFRYDKRGVSKSLGDIKSPNEIQFLDYVNDVKSIINHFKDTKKYKKIVIIGHSEGSLIGMLASKSIADGFISIAGAGVDYLTLIQRQLSNRAPYIKSMSDPIIEQLKKNKLVDSVPPMLKNLFGTNIQRFLIDASRFDPAAEISKLLIPILIIQGTNDIQVEVKDAEILHTASSKSKLKIIQGMNHVFRQVSENFILNLQTYANPDLPIDENLPVIISEFIFEK
jgi:alpha-beta hydrolase superfamily lysophospholipase